MSTLKALRQERSQEVVEAAIHERRDLLRGMVGTLYQGVILEEIAELHDLLAELRHAQGTPMMKSPLEWAD